MRPADTKAPGTLWGKIKRSPHPHARILSIDTRKAEALPGVKAVVTAADVSDIASEEAFVGERPMNFRDLSRNVTARDKALYEGHAVRAATGEPVRHILDLVSPVHAHAADRTSPGGSVRTQASGCRACSDSAGFDRPYPPFTMARPSADTDRGIVLLLGHGSKIAERNGMSVQESANHLQRVSMELRAYVQNNSDIDDDAVPRHRRGGHSGIWRDFDAPVMRTPQTPVSGHFSSCYTHHCWRLDRRHTRP